MCHGGILPSTAEAVRKHDEHTNPFNPISLVFHQRDYPVVTKVMRPVSVELSAHASREISGWLKGKTRPGDAHPYLVSFYF